MTYRGQVKNGVVVLTGRAKPAEGTRVEVKPVAPPKRRKVAASPLGEMLLKYAGKAKGLPSDMARNHDHYLHGQPKR